MAHFAISIGIDWADQKHDFCYQVAGSQKLVRGIFNHTPEAIDAWVQGLRRKAPDGTIAICLEQAKGALVFALMKYEFITLFPINPNTLARYREAFSPSRAKDDPVDAQYLFEILTRHPEKLTPWQPEPEDMRLLQRLVDSRQKLVNDLKRLGNRLTNTLKEYFPLILELFPKVHSTIVCDFILEFPTLEKAKATSDVDLLAFFRTHRSCHTAKNQKRLELMHEALPITTDRAVIESNALLAQAIARELRVVNASIDEFESKISELYQKHKDREIFDSLPSVGDITGPRLLAALGSDRTRFNSAKELQQFSGIAPVLERSGNSSWTHWRFLRPTHISQTFIDFSFLSLRTSYWAEAFYAAQRAKGKSHNKAIRALAFKWQRIIFAMWKNKTTYNETNYLKNLNSKGSPLLRSFVPVQ